MDYAEVFGPDWNSLSKSTQAYFIRTASTQADFIVTVYGPEKSTIMADFQAFLVSMMDNEGRTSRESERIASGVVKLVESLASGAIPHPVLSSDEILEEISEAADEIKQKMKNGMDRFEAESDTFDRCFPSAWRDRNNVSLEWIWGQLQDRLGPDRDTRFPDLNADEDMKA